jgi:hypothetical protein
MNNLDDCPKAAGKQAMACCACAPAVSSARSWYRNLRGMTDSATGILKGEYDQPANALNIHSALLSKAAPQAYTAKWHPSRHALISLILLSRCKAFIHYIVPRRMFRTAMCTGRVRTCDCAWRSRGMLLKGSVEVIIHLTAEVLLPTVKLCAWR